MRRIWKVWHRTDKRWCFKGKRFETRSEAQRAITGVTKLKRDPLTNWFRVNAIPKMTHV